MSAAASTNAWVVTGGPDTGVMTLVAQAFNEGGAEVNHVSDHGRTPLMAAAYVGNVGVVKMLIEAKADSNVRWRVRVGRRPLLGVS